MQKVVCPYCGRVAKYVDSSVIYYGHSYGMAYRKAQNAIGQLKKNPSLLKAGVFAGYLLSPKS